MQMNDYIDHLFSYLSAERIYTLSCGHVIPSENLVALPICKGPTRQELEFTFEKRVSNVMVSYSLNLYIMKISDH